MIFWKAFNGPNDNNTYIPSALKFQVTHFEDCETWKL